MPTTTKKNKAAVALGRLGGIAGTGDSKKRSAAHYKTIAAMGVKARLAKQTNKAGDGKAKKIS